MGTLKSRCEIAHLDYIDYTNPGLHESSLSALKSFPFSPPLLPARSPAAHRFPAIGAMHVARSQTDRQTVALAVEQQQRIESAKEPEFE